MTDHEWEAREKARELDNCYSRPVELTMMQIHGALASLIYAVKEDMPYGCGVELRYRSGTYLSVEVECSAKNMQCVVDRLRRGVIWGHYDYRFKSVCHPTKGHYDNWDTVTVSASVDLCHVEKHLRKDAA
jgi:hypothetical protein